METTKEIISAGLAAKKKSISPEEFLSTYQPTQENLLILAEGCIRLSFNEAKHIFSQSISFERESLRDRVNRLRYVYRIKANGQYLAVFEDPPVTFLRNVRGCLIQQATALFDIKLRGYYREVTQALGSSMDISDLKPKFDSMKSYRGLRKNLSRSFEGSNASRTTWENIKKFDRRLLSLSMKSRLTPLLSVYEWMVENKDKVDAVTREHGDHGILLLFDEIQGLLQGGDKDIPQHGSLYLKMLTSPVSKHFKKLSINKCNRYLIQLHNICSISKGHHDIDQFFEFASEHGIPEEGDLSLYTDLGNELYFKNIEKIRSIGSISRNQSIKRSLMEIASFVDEDNGWIIEYVDYLNNLEYSYEFSYIDSFSVQKSNVYKSNMLSWINRFSINPRFDPRNGKIEFDIKASVTMSDLKGEVEDRNAREVLYYHIETQSKIKPIKASIKDGDLVFDDLDEKQIHFKDAIRRNRKVIISQMLVKQIQVLVSSNDFFEEKKDRLGNAILEAIDSCKVSDDIKHRAILGLMRHDFLRHTPIYRDDLAVGECFSSMLDDVLSRESFYERTLNLKGRKFSPFSILLPLIERGGSFNMQVKEAMIRSVSSAVRRFKPEQMNAVFYFFLIREPLLTKLKKDGFATDILDAYTHFGEKLGRALIAKDVHKNKVNKQRFSNDVDYGYLHRFLQKNEALRIAKMINENTARVQEVTVKPSRARSLSV